MTPRTGILLIRSAATVTGIFFIAAIIPLSSDFYTLRFGIMIGLLGLAVLFFIQKYWRIGGSFLALAALFNPFLYPHIPHYYWVIFDIIGLAAVTYCANWATNPYAKGVRFEQYVSTLFPESNFIIKTRTRDISKFSNRLVESDMDPDFVFHSKKTNKPFAVECKWNGQWKQSKKGELGLWWNMRKGDNYRLYQERTGVPVWIAFGIGGNPGAPQETRFLKLNDVRSVFLSQRLIQSGETPLTIGSVV